MSDEDLDEENFDESEDEEPKDFDSAPEEDQEKEEPEPEPEPPAPEEEKPQEEAPEAPSPAEPAEEAAPEEEKEPAESPEPVEICPYCGKPLIRKNINGKTWYLHEAGEECRAIFKGPDALKEARETKELLEEEQRREEEKKKREEAERREREKLEKPFREAAQKTADMVMECLKARLDDLQKDYASQLEARNRDLERASARLEELLKPEETADGVAECLKTRLDDLQKRYSELLESQSKDLEQARSKLEELLKPKEAVSIPERSQISNAIEAYKTKVNQSADGDPNTQAYDYLETSFNELLAARDEAEGLINTTRKSTEALKARVDAAVKDIQEKMEKASMDGKEYETIQNSITESGQGVILALEAQLENLERLFFRKS